MASTALENPLKTKVLSLKSILESGTDGPADTLLQALKDLHTLGALPTQILSDTKIGIAVNLLAKESKLSDAVREEARKLVDYYRQSYRKRKASTELLPDRAVLSCANGHDSESGAQTGANSADPALKSSTSSHSC